MVLRFFLLAAIFLLASCVQIERNNPDDPGSPNYGTGSQLLGSHEVRGPSVTYEGETYETVVIGTQTWFKRNLNYAIGGSKCYLNEKDYCTTYGRLYNLTMAKTVCPNGWHLPSDEEWTTLVAFVGFDAGTKLKAKSKWNDYNGISGNGTDDYGFSALPGDRFIYNDFTEVGKAGYWWSATEPWIDGGGAIIRFMESNSKDVGYSVYESDVFLSVRCVKDNRI